MPASFVSGFVIDGSATRHAADCATYSLSSRLQGRGRRLKTSSCTAFQRW
jgi:hypothetical protein